MTDDKPKDETEKPDQNLGERVADMGRAAVAGTKDGSANEFKPDPADTPEQQAAYGRNWNDAYKKR